MIRVLLVLFLLINPIYAQNELDSLINVLEKEMEKRDFYDQAKEQRITNLKTLLAEEGITAKNKFFITNKLITEYSYYSFNESLKYINNNIDLAKAIENDSMLIESNLKLSKILATSGRYIESIDILNEIDRVSIPQRLIWDYYFNYKRCYSELRYISNIKSINDKYDELYLTYKDSLNSVISNLEKNTDTYLDIIEQNFRDTNQLEEALEINTKRLAMATMSTREYSLATFYRSIMIWNYNKDKSKQKKYLILSAISDIQGSIKDNASLTNLAEILFEEGEIEKAHKYINFSLEDAKFYNSRLRFFNFALISPEISNAFETQIQDQSDKLKNQLLFISALSIVLIIALTFIFKQYKKIKIGREKLKTVNFQLKELNHELTVTNKDLKRLYEELSEVDNIKEQYIGTFLNLYSEYIDKLDVYRKVVRKHILTNKTNDLLELTKSKQVIETELKLFYTNFDKSFLHIYPSFIKSVNALLKPEEQIIIDEGETLNTELRVLALIRLGITNSAKISKILRYSVNTIYNYRVKLRNGALDRQQFEDLVKKIA
ncbi:DUF6377 domain-containing protein [Algibacter sp.]|nr:DUF6377 domain-containing protein [Algibacter sp.]MDA9775359.1 DUF6377 domain-containing protein [Algibacter sp.]MDC1321668.1 DUF6377 domain-containing protein [bacterium]